MIEPNITKWRRAVTGDLTSAFDFRSPSAARFSLPTTVGYAPPDTAVHPDYVPAPPTVQVMPVQEPGVRPARAVPYELHATADLDPAGNALRIHFANSGKAAAVFQVRASRSENGPWTYTVGPGARLSDTWPVALDESHVGSAHDLSVYGPNGFLRTFKGRVSGKGSSSGTDRTDLDVRVAYRPRRCGLSLELRNRGADLCTLRISNAYAAGKALVVHSLESGETVTRHFSLAESFGWYDLTIAVDSDPSFERRVAGHVESGDDSMTDPAIGTT